MVLAVAKAARGRCDGRSSARRPATRPRRPRPTARPPGWTSIVVLPKGQIALGKLLQALVAGARVVAIDGNFDQALAHRAGACRTGRPSGDAGQLGQPVPHRRPDDRAFEVCDDLGRAPDVLAIPVGNAGNITAYWAGFRAYAEAGDRDRRGRRCAGFQAAGAAPIVVGHRSSIRRPSRRRSGSATRPRGTRRSTPATPRAAGSTAVTDEEILAVVPRRSHGYEGVFCEPASAAGVAGITRGGDGGRARPGRDGRVRPDRHTASRTRRRPSARSRRSSRPSRPSGRSPSRWAGRRPPWPTGSPSSMAAG